MTEFPLLPLPTPKRDSRPPGQPNPDPGPLVPGRQRQGERLSPVFERLRGVFREGRDPVTLQSDPSAIAPERAIVFEIAGSLADFHQAARRVDGLEYLAEEEVEFPADDDFAERDKRKGRVGDPRMDKLVTGRLYLAMPDGRALRELLSLWDRHQTGAKPERGFRPWSDLFDRLHALRPWGPEDRILPETVSYWEDALEAAADGVVRTEVELWSFASPERQREANERFLATVRESGGVIVDRASIPPIGYEAALVDLPVREVRRLIQREQVRLAICDDVMFLRPQSTARFPTVVEAIGDAPTVTARPDADLPPIAAVLDGMPVQGHALLDDWLRLDDPDDIETMSVVADRAHGTAMASLVIHGDRILAEAPLVRPIYLRPVLYAPGQGLDERPPLDRLLLDLIYRAVLRMREGDAEGPATAPEVFIINLSLGDENRPFTGPMSPWGRLLDYLAERYGILFIVSAGNIRQALEVRHFQGLTEFEAADNATRRSAVLEALGEQRAQRTLLSPAEALNVITVGAWHEDAVAVPDGLQSPYAPYADEAGPNISSALGLGHRKVVKPDIFMPGGRERVRITGSGSALSLRPAVPGRLFGLRVAIPDPSGRVDREGLTSGTSAAAALATRAAHQIFDALSDPNNGGLLLTADPAHFAVVVKAMLVHRARWDGTGELLETLYGPTGQGSSVGRRDNIARVLGHGCPAVEEALSCAPNRASLVGFGTVSADGVAQLYRVPLPGSLERVTEPRSLTVTLAWMSPVNIRHQAYRRAKLEVKPDDLRQAFGVKRVADQPSDKSVPRGSVFHVRYAGAEAVPFIDDGHLRFRVFCREQGGHLDHEIRYGIAVTIEAGEAVPVYQEIRQRLAVRSPV